MPGSSHTWQPTDWQDYAEALFRERHGSTGYVPVPDGDRGDLGIEGYSIAIPKIMYQCYVCEAIEVGKRYESQRDKITVDIGKMVKREGRFLELLGDNVMSYWVLMVPLHDSKELVKHCRSKEQEVRQKNLPFLSQDFQILVWTEGDFLKERRALDIAGVGSVPRADPLSESEMTESIEAFESAQVQTLDAKLGRASAGTAGFAVTAARDRILREIVEADNIREHLRLNFPTTSERLIGQLSMEERAILQERDFQQLHAGSVVTVRERLQTRLATNLPTLGLDDADALAYGAVGRWLLECPIDFPEVAKSHA